MTTLGTRTKLTRLTLGSIWTTSALGLVLIAFACGNNGTTATPPGADMTGTGADMAVAPGTPLLSGVSPKLVSTAGGSSVSLSGSGFVLGATVKLGTVTIPPSDITVSGDGTAITIKIPPRLGMAGKVDVSVTNPDSQSTTLAGALTYFFGQSSFGTPTAVGVDRGPRCIIVADMKKDGKLDLVTANFNGNTVSVLVGDDTGAFTNTITRGTGTGPYNVAVGDLDGDGKLDVVSANQGTNAGLSVMLGDGTGLLDSPMQNTGSLGMKPQSVAIVDFNNDGMMDLVASNFGNTTNNLSFLTGNKTNTFSGIGSITVNGGSLYNLVVDDFNKDNKLDIVGVHQSAVDAINVSPLINKGNTAAPFFTVGTNKSSGTNPTGITVGDFDNDGNKDLAVANQGSNTVSFLKGSGTGTFTDTGANGVTTVGTGPEHLAAVDVNLDGNLDLVVANFGSGNLSLLLGHGDGTFDAAVTVSAGNGVKPNWVAVGDFNKDGKIDLAVTDYNAAALSGRIMILLNSSQ